jgi:hypothetical protein
MVPQVRPLFWSIACFPVLSGLDEGLWRTPNEHHSLEKHDRASI